LRALRGALELVADERGRIVLVSPGEVALASGTIDAVVVAVDDAGAIAAIGVEVRGGPEAAWQSFAHVRGGDCERTPAGVLVRRMSPARDVAIDQVRLTLVLAVDTRTTLRRLAILRAA
jgi:hypothetical protein